MCVCVLCVYKATWWEVVWVVMTTPTQTASRNPPSTFFVPLMATDDHTRPDRLLGHLRAAARVVPDCFAWSVCGRSVSASVIDVVCGVGWGGSDHHKLPARARGTRSLSAYKPAVDKAAAFVRLRDPLLGVWCVCVCVYNNAHIDRWNDDAG
jgi:hypothetical protein